MFLKLRNYFQLSLLVFSLFLSSSLNHSSIFAQTTDRQGNVVRSDTGLVVSSSPAASKVGAKILRQGGNAVDAAVATAFAMAVTWPTAGNIGGGGFMVVRQPNGQAITIDYREKSTA